MNEFNDPNLFDFPCSYSWRAYYEETMYGRYLPALDPEVPERDPVEVVVKHIYVHEYPKIKQEQGEELYR